MGVPALLLTLRSLTLCENEDEAAAGEHPSLRSLTLCENEDEAAPPPAATAGAALGALVAADSAALQTFVLQSPRGLNDAVLGPLVDALAQNTHLLSLHLMRWW